MSRQPTDFTRTVQERGIPCPPHKETQAQGAYQQTEKRTTSLCNKPCQARAEAVAAIQKGHHLRCVTSLGKHGPKPSRLWTSTGARATPNKPSAVPRTIWLPGYKHVHTRTNDLTGGRVSVMFAKNVRLYKPNRRQTDARFLSAVQTFPSSSTYDPEYSPWVIADCVSIRK